MRRSVSDFLKITCHLASPIGGDVPMLDSILEYEMAQRLGLAGKIQRSEPAPPYGMITIPIARHWIGGLLIPCCSSPIVEPAQESVERFAKRLSTEHADLLKPSERKMVPVGNGLFKSYRLPIRLRHTSQIVWFTTGTRRHVLKLLKSVVSLGKKRSYGYGIIKEWTAEKIDEDLSWFAPTDSGTILMRPLPACDDLPADLIGFRKEFGAAQSPYWHPDRYIERVVPC
jgi:hypothetical protein